MKDGPRPDKRCKDDTVLILVEQSRSVKAAAGALNIDAKCLYSWQENDQAPALAALGAALNPATAAELRQRQAHVFDILKKPSPSFPRCRLNELLPLQRR